MSISSAKATHGLIATFSATGPNVSWTERIGGVPESVNLTAATHGYEMIATLGMEDDTLTIDLAQGSAAITGPGTTASGTLTLSGNAVADETVTIGAKTYTWKASVSTTANQVKIGATASDSLDNLIAAINAGAGSGTVYGSATTANSAGTAAAGTGDTLVFTAAAVGTSYNSTATTESMTNGSWNAATLTGGANASSLTGGDGKDNEGNDIPTQSAVDSVRICCNSGQVSINFASTVATIGSGGVILIADPAGISGLVTSGILLTATAADSAVSIEVISHIAA